MQWKSTTETHESDGYALPLVERQRMSEQFRIYWRPDKMNYADYWTKHHTATYHKGVRKEFLTPHRVVEMLRVEQDRVAAATA